MDDNDVNVRRIAEILYEQYNAVVRNLSIKDIKAKDRWTMLAIEAKVRNFLNNVSNMYESLWKIDLDWIPYDFNICLNEYGEDNEYFIDIVAGVMDIDIDNEKDCSYGDVVFTVSFNDERIPSLEEYGETIYNGNGDIENEDENNIDRLLYGDDDEDDSDKPWLR